jgi:glycosyltransferase involved in cell wall biosynthesis
MNRAIKLSTAIQSSLECKLPTNTEYIIVDNASTDNTSSIVTTLLCSVPHKYIKMDHNVGVAPARNIGFEAAQGKFIYFMDDDLHIPQNIRDSIFLDLISFLESNPNVAIASTAIYDETYKMYLKLITSTATVSGRNQSFVYHGGSHILRKDYFKVPLYPQITFGVEELYLGLQVHHSNKKIVVFDNLVTIHSPTYKINDLEDSMYKKRHIYALANPYAIKSKMYPIIFLPLLKLTLWIKYIKYGVGKELKKEIRNQVRNLKSILPDNKISFKTVALLYRDYGFRIFT